jgi:predicted phosphodiesterase
MESKFANYHDPHSSMIQSAVNEFLMHHKIGRPQGLNYDHEKMQKLSQTLSGEVKLQAPEKRSLIKRIVLFIQILLLKRKVKHHEHYCFKILKEYVHAKLHHDTVVQQEKLEELRYSTCDPKWVESMIQWFDHYIAKMQKPKYITYKSIDDFSYKLPSKNEGVKVGLIADWGTGEQMAELVLDQVFKHKPDVIIHLGDVYYSGTEKEYEKHFTRIINSLRQQHSLPVPVYNLPGNHDYYSGGHAFYDNLKTINQNLNGAPEQEASYFALSNQFWHIQGMDTGYYDNNVLKVAKDMTHLTDTEIKWHQHHLEKAIKSEKKVILLSHHQLFSRYQAIGGKSHNPYLYSCFEKYIESNKITTWYWGHEHLLAVYKPYMNLEKGRCIGHGAVPILYNNGKPYKETASVKGKPIPNLPESLLPDDVLPNNGDVYDCGFVILDLKNDQSAKASYYSVGNGEGKVKLSLNYEEALCPSSLIHQSTLGIS